MAVYIIWGSQEYHVYIAYGLLCMAVSIACFSSAMANIMTMLRLLTSMSEDNMLPVPHCEWLMKRLSKACVCDGNGNRNRNPSSEVLTLNVRFRRLLSRRLRSGESQVAMLTCAVFIAITMIPVDLNSIANLLTEVILFVYALINYVTLRKPGATTVLALLGTAFCGFGALMINAYLAFVLLLVILALKKMHKPTVTFTQFSDNHKLNTVARVLADNTSRNLPPSTYVPRCLLVSETKYFHPAVLRLAQSLSAQSIFYAVKLSTNNGDKKTISGNIAEKSQRMIRQEDLRKNESMAATIAAMRQHGITKCSYRDMSMNCDWNTAFDDLIRNEVGSRPLQADTLLEEFPDDWETRDYAGFCSRIRNVFARGYGTILVRMPDKYNSVRKLSDNSTQEINLEQKLSSITTANTGRSMRFNKPSTVRINAEVEVHTVDKDTLNDSESVIVPLSSSKHSVPQNLAGDDDFFTRWMQTHGRIGCYWRYDDGGLTVLLSYMLRNMSAARQQFDVFVRGTFDVNGQVDAENSGVNGVSPAPAAVGLDCVGCGVRRRPDPPKVVSDALKRLRLAPDRCEQLALSGPPPTAEQVPRFAERMRKFVEKEEISAEWAADEDLRSRLQRVYYLKKAIIQHSKEQSLIVVTFPLQLRVGQGREVPPCFYMSLLDELSSGFQVPVLMVRGSPVSCLTPYQ